MASPLPSCPCYSEALERNAKHQMQFTETTTQNTANHRCSGEMESTRCREVGALYLPSPPNFRDVRGQRDM